MSGYMPPIAVSRSDSLSKEPQSSSQKSRPKASAFKQTTLSFSKKPSTIRPAVPARPAAMGIVDLSDI